MLICITLVESLVFITIIIIITGILIGIAAMCKSLPFITESAQIFSKWLTFYASLLEFWNSPSTFMLVLLFQYDKMSYSPFNSFPCSSVNLSHFQLLGTFRSTRNFETHFSSRVWARATLLKLHSEYTE